LTFFFVFCQPISGQDKVSFKGKGEAFKISLPYITTPVKSIKGKGGNVKMHFGRNFIYSLFG
jgi:hypothetical protein